MLGLILVFAVIEKLDAVLEEYFPRTADDTNELPDEVIVLAKLIRFGE